MTYMYGVTASVADVKTFAEAGNSWVKDRLIEMGALEVGASQIVMGGAAAGTVGVSFSTETADAAMELNAAFYQDPELVKMMQDTGVQVSTRALAKMQVVVGNTDAEYVVSNLGSGMPLSEEQWKYNFDVFWSKAGGAATGMRGVQMISNGPSPITAMGSAWGNSIDEMLAATAEAWMDPGVQENMASTGGSIVGRVIASKLF